MKIAFFSNYLNHHQLPFCLAMEKYTNNNFVFVATKEIPQSRLDLGYEDMNKKHDFVIRAYENDDAKKEAEKIAVEYDVMIFGDADSFYLKKRMKNNGLTFIYSERLNKKGLYGAFNPKRLFFVLKDFLPIKNKNVYLLSASAYAPYDYSLYGMFKNKSYKWGYFPQVKKYDDLDEIINKKQKNSIIWVGRFIGWKHPEVPIEIAHRLKADGYDFELRLIGKGVLEEKIKHDVEKRGLSGCVELLGSMSPESVRENMEKSRIFLFTSDFNEGWGAVLNEAMNSGCVCIASHAIGSVPFLIHDGENGLIFKNEDADGLYKKVKAFLENNERTACLGRKAYETLKDTWNAENAAQRLISMVREINDHGYCDLFSDGPCSKALILKQNWFRE